MAPPKPRSLWFLRDRWTYLLELVKIQGPSVVRPVKIEHDETCAKGAGNWDEAKDEGNKKATNQATK